MSIKQFFRSFLAVLMILAAYMGSVVHAGPKPEEARVLTFGFVPQQAASTLLRTWGPVLRYLSEETGYRFVFRTAPDIPTFEDRLAAGEYDFAYMNPYHFTVFNDGDAGYQAVAHAAGKRINGILVVRKDSPIESLDDLNGAELAFPAPAAFAASVLPRANLEANGIAFEPRYVSSHDSVYQAVAKGLFPAGGGVMRTLNATNPQVKEQLRVLWTTPGYTPHAVAAHARVDSGVVMKVKHALVSLDGEGKDKAILDGVRIKGFEAAGNADWDDVRGLGIHVPVGNQAPAS